MADKTGSIILLELVDSEQDFGIIIDSQLKPTIEYRNIIWGTNYKLDSAELEKVQRKATKLLLGLKDLTYEDRLCHLQLPSLKYRWQCGDHT
ncbi:hypothetical protein QYM36_010212 [Artemia franciscana]|uniref:Uncharacterized protein n=1 Tax=Artemia franciscana TaxID=6661 RepID=A0AA88HSJ0_ARTSF|nr:hypothetical protein QYM36_010212 [Artemia franciscana]